MGDRTYSDDALVEAVEAARSWRGVLRELGLAATSAAAARSVKLRAAGLGLDSSHFTGQRRWAEDDLAAAVADSTSWSQVARKLGLSGGSTNALLKGHAVPTRARLVAFQHLAGGTARKAYVPARPREPAPRGLVDGRNLVDAVRV